MHHPRQLPDTSNLEQLVALLGSRLSRNAVLVLACCKAEVDAKNMVLACRKAEIDAKKWYLPVTKLR